MAAADLHAASLIREGKIKLLSGVWLVECTDPVRRQQDLPADAFLAAEQAARLLEGDRRGLLYVVSYGWITPDHPDPDMWHLGTLQRYLYELIEAINSEGGRLPHRRHGDMPAEEPSSPRARSSSGALFRDVGVFWDFPSLPQQPRTEEEQLAFKAGLKALNALYGSKRSTVLQLKAMPPRPAGAATASLLCWPCAATCADGGEARSAPIRPYAARGWCVFEQTVASTTPAGFLQKSVIDLSRVARYGVINFSAVAGSDDDASLEEAIRRRMLELGLLEKDLREWFNLEERSVVPCSEGFRVTFVRKRDVLSCDDMHSTYSGDSCFGDLGPFTCTSILASGDLLPPMHPDDFATALAKLQFTNGADRSIVAGIYRDFFASVVDSGENFNFSAPCSAAPLPVGHLADADARDLGRVQAAWSRRGGRWGAEEAAKLAASLPAFTRCRGVALAGHCFDDEALVVLVGGLAKMPCLEYLDLRWNPYGSGGIRALADSVGTSMAQLKTLKVQLNPTAQLGQLEAAWASAGKEHGSLSSTTTWNRIATSKELSSLFDENHPDMIDLNVVSLSFADPSQEEIDLFFPELARR